MAAPFRFNRQKPAPCCHCASKVFMSRLEHSNQFGRFSMPHRFDRCDSMAIQRQFLHHPASCRDGTARWLLFGQRLRSPFVTKLTFGVPPRVQRKILPHCSISSERLTPANFYRRQDTCLQVNANITDTKIYSLYGNVVARQQYNTRKLRT